MALVLLSSLAAIFGNTSQIRRRNRNVDCSVKALFGTRPAENCLFGRWAFSGSDFLGRYASVNSVFGIQLVALVSIPAVVVLVSSGASGNNSRISGIGAGTRGLELFSQSQCFRPYSR